MNQCFVIADRARARLFTVEETGDATSETRYRHLREHRDLVNPEGQLTDRELFRDRRAGRRSRSSVVGGGYGLDDHKDGERAESTRRFAKELAKATAALVRAQKSKTLVLVASPKFLGVARSEVRKAIPKNVELAVLAEDLSWHATSRLEGVLARHRVFETSEPVVAYRRRAKAKHPKRSLRPPKKA